MLAEAFLALIIVGAILSNGDESRSSRRQKSAWKRKNKKHYRWYD
jgi:hypothetical protein